VLSLIRCLRGTTPRSRVHALTSLRGCEAVFWWNDALDTVVVFRVLGSPECHDTLWLPRVGGVSWSRPRSGIYQLWDVFIFYWVGVFPHLSESLHSPRGRDSTCMTIVMASVAISCGSLHTYASLHIYILSGSLHSYASLHTFIFLWQSPQLCWVAYIFIWQSPYPC